MIATIELGFPLEIMNLKSFNFLLIILVLSAALLPTLMAVDIIDAEEDDLAEDDFFVMGDFLFAPTGTPGSQVSILLKSGMSIFALFVVYLGGRSKHKRFNDRTLDHVNALGGMFCMSLKTALSSRAVFNFPYPIFN